MTIRPEMEREVDREAESVALEKKHVHDVYARIAPHFGDRHYKAWPRVKEFLLELEPGSIVADVGCGNGKYLGINNQVFKIGSDCCPDIVGISGGRGHEAMVCDNLRLPYRDDSFDAVISIAVVHHFATAERRVQAIRELARICRPGGLVMIYVWAMEQAHRRFDAQDVLVPWHLQPKSTRNRRGKARSNDSSSSGSDDDSEATLKCGGMGKAKSRLLKTKPQHPSIIKAASPKAVSPKAVSPKAASPQGPTGVLRSSKQGKKVKRTLQRQTTERDWLREKFPTRHERLRREETRMLRKCHSCEESVVLSGKPRSNSASSTTTTKTRCSSDSMMQTALRRRRMVSRSASVEEGERGGTLWDGFLQVFPAHYSPTSGRSEDDMTPGDANSVFGDDDEEEDLVKNQWCIINRDGSMMNYESKNRKVFGQGVKSMRCRSHLLLNASGSCDNILARSSKPKYVPKHSSPLLSSQSLDERDFERVNSQPSPRDRFCAMKKALSSFPNNSESAINHKLLKGSNPKVSTWSSDTSGFVSSGSVNGDCSENTKKLLNWRKAQLKLNLRTDETREKPAKPLNGMFAKSLELLYKTEGKVFKKPSIGLNLTAAKEEVFKPPRPRARLTHSGSEKEQEESFDSVSSSDESVTTYPIDPTNGSSMIAGPRRGPSPKPFMQVRSHSLSTLEKGPSKDSKHSDSPLTMKPPSSRSASLNDDSEPLFEFCKPRKMSQSEDVTRNDEEQQRPASNPNLPSAHLNSHQSKPNQMGAGPTNCNGSDINTDDPSLFLRYYHVFKDGELTNLIEKNLENLHIVKSYYDHANWCVVAEKVEVWRI